jgi:hypothetical protein
MPSSASPLRRLANWLTNGLILMALGLMLLQGLPLNMPGATLRARYLADWLGIGHQPWDMYAPVPDSQNHRIVAELLDGNDHVVARWHSPEWRKQAAMQRFWGHRWTEYYDNVWWNSNDYLWNRLAQHVAAETRIQPYDPDQRPTQVKLIAEVQSLAAPVGNRWPRPVPPDDYNDNWVLSIEPLP